MADIRFDFNKEVARAYDDFPQLRNHTAFVDFADPSLTIIQSNQQMTMSKRLKRNLKKIGSCVYPVKSTSGKEFNLVSLHPKKRLNVLNENTDKYKTFDHEVGHCLIPGRKTIFRENAADAFGAIRYLQRFGRHEDIAIVSAARSYYLMKDADWKHLSSPLLNQIVEDSKSFDFKSLSPEETVQKAKNYAERFTPSENDMDTFSGMRINRLSRFLPKKWSIKYHSWKAFRRKGPLATEVGASLIRPFLSPEGADFMGKRVTFSPKEREKLQNRYQKSLARSG